MKKWSLWLLFISGLLALLIHFSEERAQRKFSSSAPIRLLMNQKVSSYVVPGRLTGKTLSREVGEVFQITSKEGELKITRRADHFLVGAMIIQQDRVLLMWDHEDDNAGPKGLLEFIAGKENDFDVVLHQELEPYVAGVVMAEMKPHWPMEALKAQAICARSYAKFHINRHQRRHYDLWGNSRSQAYSQKPPSEKVMLAVEATEGKVLSYDGTVVMAYYMSTCGGETRKHSLEGVPYASVSCGYCQASPHFEWEVTLTLGDMKRLVSKGVDSEASIVAVEVIAEDSGHARKLHMIPDLGPPVAVEALAFRRHLNRAFGKEVVKSLVFSVEKRDRDWRIRGKGWGYHGRGLCQYGAKGMALSGVEYLMILKHYYPNFSPVTLH